MKLSLTQLESYVADLITTNKISNDTFNVTRNNIVGLLDKIGKIVTIDQEYVDLLPELDGTPMKFGKIVEEYHEDLTMPEPFDRAGSGALKYKESSYRPVFYSYPIPRDKFKITIPYGDVEGAVHNAEEFARIIAMKHKRLEDSVNLYKFQLKKELLGKIIDLAVSEMSASNPTFDKDTDYSVNALVKNANTPTAFGIVVKPYDASEEDVDDWADAVAQGFIIELHLVEELAKPVDTETGEAFIESVKVLAERLRENGEGDSLNGNVLGTQNTLQMYILHGIIPNLEVQTQAGAFQIGKLTMPIDVKPLANFGSADKKYYAIVIDRRGVALHECYNATRSEENADGDFMSIYRHLQYTPYASRNTCIHIYKQPDATLKATAKKVSK